MELRPRISLAKLQLAKNEVEIKKKKPTTHALWFQIFIRAIVNNIDGAAIIVQITAVNL